ncbi:translation elongation factor 2 (EF-2/EF-G) [Breoghania corrubedonensis]|uniref:Elongation factor G n=1 Tax=Breoghania corrubedonensis TaxID=665038 RepID=A0A2T5V5U5_9HYPH|nr:elongation factor G [Breoghania corrubedonensis]PTW59125.1 translation elongation factor 2 (EF-2/EF-G) [Breoghania corrubedonensis]
MGDANGRVAGPRCIALVGPFASGKTSLLEAILARTGAIHRQGTVSQGNTVGDASPEARAHAMSVEANIAETSFMGDDYTFIDCPGSVEFLFETQGVLAGVDAAIVVAEADEKKVPALQLILKQLEERGVPHLVFLNKIDKVDGRVHDILTMLQPASAVPLVLRQIPIRKDGRIAGFIDLALERAHIYQEQAPSEVIDFPSAERERELEARFEMLEAVADYDDALMEQLLEDIQPDADHVFTDLVKETREGQICPVFLGSAEHGNGIARLMKALRHEAPAVGRTCERLGLDEGTGSVVQVLKTFHTPHAGKLSVVRVLEGTVADASVLMRADGSESRVSGVLKVIGTQTSKRGPAGRGETVVLGKLETAQTGDTLRVDAPPASNLVTLEPPEPVMAYAVRAGDRKDEVKLSAALTRILEEDPSLIFEQVQDTAETLLRGQGEMHLRVALERLTGKYGIPVETGHPHVPYKETIRTTTSVRGRHKKQSGGHGQFGDVVLTIAPVPRGEGIVFTSTITGGVVPKQYIPSVEAGVKDYLREGPLGFPIVDIAVTLTDGSYHSVDSSDQAFKAAAQVGMREGMEACKPVLLEPIMDVTLFCPSEATAKINAIVSSRRGQILGFDARPDWLGWDQVKATMPAAEIQDLIIEMRSATAGVGTFISRFDHLSELTGKLADQVLQHHGRQAA